MSVEDVLMLDDTNWESYVEKGEKPVVVMFSSPTCPYCHQMRPHFEEYATEFKERIIFAEVDISESPTIASRYSVLGTPTFKFFCKGHPVHEMTGAVYPTLLKKNVEDHLEHGEECVKNTTWNAPEITGYA
jgi:thiol-disulfide isomerase/thioredoxin